MKKFISVLLVLAAMLGLASGVTMAAALDGTCDAAAAGVVVTTEKAPEEKHYFETLSTTLFNTICLELDGPKTVLLLKDLDLSTLDSQFDSSNLLSLPTNTGDYFGTAPGKNPVTIDLGGHTLSYTGDKNLFFMRRYPPTIKNGTIVYSYTGARTDCAVFSMGGSSFQTTTSSGEKAWFPEMTLENLHVYNITGTGSVIGSYFFNTTVNAKDCVLWAAGGPAILVGKTTEAKAKKFTGPFQPQFNLEDTIVGCGGETAAVELKSPATTAEISAKNSGFVSGGQTMLPDALKAKLNLNDQKLSASKPWSLFLSCGKLAAGNAWAVGNMPEFAVSCSFTDVQKDAWYYTYVCDLASAGIVNGMTATTFAPNGTLTYGQALKLIAKAVGLPDMAPTGSHWASGYMNYALDEGWLYEEPSPDAKINRAAFCAIAVTATGIYTQPAKNPFTDTADPAVLALYNAGVISGMTDTTFQPGGYLTRAQISKIIWGLLAL